FGRPIAGERGRVVLELDDDVARAALAFHLLERAAAHEEPCAVFAERLGIGGHIGLVAVRVRHIDTPHPISLGHPLLPFPRSGPRRRREPGTHDRRSIGVQGFRIAASRLPERRTTSHFLSAAAISATMASTASAASRASTIGRPTTT